MKDPRLSSTGYHPAGWTACLRCEKPVIGPNNVIQDHVASQWTHWSPALLKAIPDRGPKGHIIEGKWLSEPEVVVAHIPTRNSVNVCLECWNLDIKTSFDHCGICEKPVDLVGERSEAYLLKKHGMKQTFLGQSSFHIDCLPKDIFQDVITERNKRRDEINKGNATKS